MGCWDWLEHLQDVQETLEAVQTESHTVFKPGTRVALAPSAQGGEYVYREGTVLVRTRNNRAPAHYVHVHWDGNLITHTAMLPRELLKEL